MACTQISLLCWLNANLHPFTSLDRISSFYTLVSKCAWWLPFKNSVLRKPKVSCFTSLQSVLRGFIKAIVTIKVWFLTSSTVLNHKFITLSNFFPLSPCTTIFRLFNSDPFLLCQIINSSQLQTALLGSFFKTELKFFSLLRFKHINTT